MSEKITSTGSITPKRGQTDFDRLHELTDDEIETAIAGDPDAAPMLTNEWFQTAQVRTKRRKHHEQRTICQRMGRNRGHPGGS